tara:strand:- start:86 stop:481 length:396 start_codon:yes stop_codon:yes gene_type:complete
LPQNSGWHGSPSHASSGLGGSAGWPEPLRRYQRQRPGELIHPDIKKLSRVHQPGHRVTGTRIGCRNRGAGWDSVHVAVDDAKRLAYVEVLGDERKETVTAFLLSALRWFRNQGIHAQCVMTDNERPTTRDA